MPRVHACTGVEGCAREEIWQIILICLEPPLRFPLYPVTLCSNSSEATPSPIQSFEK